MSRYNTVLNRFINSEEFAEVVINHTKESFRGSFYMVELLPDETWNVLFFIEVDDSPVTSGVRLRIPQLSVEEFQELTEEVGTDDTQKMAEGLREKDTIKEKADILRNLLSMAQQ